MSHGSANESVLSFTIFMTSISPWKTIILIGLFCSLSLEEFTEWQEIARLLGTGSWRIPVLTATLCFCISSFPSGSRLGQPGLCPLPKKRSNWNCSYNFCQSLRPLSLIIFVRQPKVTILKKTDIRPVVALEIPIYKDQKLQIRALVQHTTCTQVCRLVQEPPTADMQLSEDSGGPALLQHLRACELSPPHWTPLLDTGSTHCPQTLQEPPACKYTRSWQKAADQSCFYLCKRSWSMQRLQCEGSVLCREGAPQRSLQPALNMLLLTHIIRTQLLMED